MPGIKLKKIIERPENLQAIEEVVKALHIEVAIKDANGIIYGSASEKNYEKEYEVTLHGQVLGYVLGDDKASCIVSILDALLLNSSEKNKLAEETLEKYKEINMIYNVSEKISSIVGVGNVAKAIISEFLSHALSSYGCIMLYDEGTERLEIVSEHNKNLAMDMGKVHRFFSEDNSFAFRVFHNKHGEIIGNSEILQVINDGQSELKAFIVSPMIVKNKVIGVVIIGSHNTMEYTASDLKLCNSLAVHSGIALEGAKLYDSLKENFYDTLKILSQIIEMKDSYRNGHYSRIMNYSLNIAKVMGLSKVDQVKLKLAVMLHDIGNLSISDELLNKKGKYTEEEFELIKKHSEIGADMLKNIDQLKEVIPAIRSHHERFDGTGYPDGLLGENIPLFSRIIALADAFDAMTNDRPYKASTSIFFAAEELKNNKALQFDPKLVDVFFEIYKDKKLAEIQSYVLSE